MRSRLILQLGRRGTRELLADHSEHLVCVCHSGNRQQKKRYKTVGLIVKQEGCESPGTPFKGETIVGLKWLREKRRWPAGFKHAGGVWKRDKRLWELCYDRVRAVGLEGRIAEPKVSRFRD